MDRRALYLSWISTLVGEVSLDPKWRWRIFLAPPRGSFAVEEDDVSRLSPDLAGAIREHALRFEIFHDGLADGNGIVFGFRSLEFPDIEAYSTNWYRPTYDDADRPAGVSSE